MSVIGRIVGKVTGADSPSEVYVLLNLLLSS